MPTPTPANFTQRTKIERLRQIRGLLLLAITILLVSLLRAGLRTVFTPGWWRLW
jgi:hypothetical protein